ncbi:TldD/PmbA family protein [bacterium]|nr:TldD/PmbA family protein [candidate division CSSED10-310 bacterium]
MNRDYAGDIINRVLNISTADDTVVNLTCSDTKATRYANNAVTQSLERFQERLAVTVSFDRRVGTAISEDLSEEGLAAVVGRAEANARLSKPDPEYVTPVAPVEYVPVNAFHQNTELFDAASRVGRIEAAVDVCRRREQLAAGVFIVGSNHVAVGNSKGLFAYHRHSNAQFTITAMTDDSSGWAEDCHEDVEQLDTVRAAETASMKALAGRRPRAVEPRKYRVLLEPAAVADLLTFMLWFYNARAADEQRSFMSGRQGTRVFHPQVNILSDPTDTRLPGVPFQDDGQPAAQVHWVRDGVAENLVCDRFWAQKSGRSATGMPTNLLMDGTDLPYEELLESMHDGLLITRFWYIRLVDHMTVLLTGMTRDSTCNVIDGSCRFGVLNLRFNESPITMLNNISAMSRPYRVGNRFIPIMMPALIVDDFNFTSRTLF